MKKNNILTNEELDMLLCISDTSLHDQSDNFNYLQIANERLLPLLNKANSLFVEANFKNHHLRFPLNIQTSDAGCIVPQLGTPDIYEHANPGRRPWRLDHPIDLELLNESGKRLPFEIINISASGLLIRGHSSALTLGEQFTGILSSASYSIHLYGVVIRNKKRKNAMQEWAIRLTLDANNHELLQEYIYQQHNHQLLKSTPELTESP